MMSLLLGHGADAVYKRECLFEIRESECACQVVLIDHLPVRPIRKLFVDFGQLFSFQWRHSPSAGHTGFGFQGLHDLLLAFRDEPTKEQDAGNFCASAPP
jgi:hypothetical protein